MTELEQTHVSTRQRSFKDIEKIATSSWAPPASFISFRFAFVRTQGAVE